MSKKKYDRSTVISKLIKLGCKPKPDLQKLAYFLIPNRVHLGIKTLGMLDFLKIRIERPKQKERKLGEKPKERPRRNNIKTIGKCMVCGKETDNANGLWRLTFNNRIIKLHKNCKNKTDILDLINKSK